MSITNVASLCKQKIFEEGRLLERLLYGYYFENIQQYQCLQALKAYQNSDGGFGNGIEQDILCPNSSAIATETALFYSEMLNAKQGSIVEDIHYWVRHNLREDGIINFPPLGFNKYPVKSWWSEPDTYRSLALVGQLILLRKIDRENVPSGIKKLASSFPKGKKIDLYDYPYYLYTYAMEGASNPSIQYLLKSLDMLQKENPKRFPLLSRYWHWIIPEVNRNMLIVIANNIYDEIRQSGGLISKDNKFLYWNATITLDSLMILSKYDMKLS